MATFGKDPEPERWWPDGSGAGATTAVGFARTTGAGATAAGWATTGAGATRAVCFFVASGIGATSAVRGGIPGVGGSQLSASTLDGGVSTVLIAIIVIPLVCCITITLLLCCSSCLVQLLAVCLGCSICLGLCCLC